MHRSAVRLRLPPPDQILDELRSLPLKDRSSLVLRDSRSRRAARSATTFTVPVASGILGRRSYTDTHLPWMRFFCPLTAGDRQRRKEAAHAYLAVLCAASNSKRPCSHAKSPTMKNAPPYAIGTNGDSGRSAVERNRPDPRKRLRTPKPQNASDKNVALSRTSRPCGVL
jgi:hypothetical protein